MPLRPFLVATILGGLVAVPACAAEGRRGTARYSRAQLSESLGAPADVGVYLGVFPLKKGAIVDGDTVKVGGLDASLRLLAIDTEETFKSEKSKRAYEQGWEAYLAEMQEASSKLIKVPTPLGEDAKHWAQDFFEGVRRVRLERDHPGEIRGRFGRLLTYVFVERDGEWVNYNVEAVRAGMSPYFTKYAYSRRFHDEFVQAQREAQEARVGIWNPDLEHYRDYPIRLAWWNARAEFIAAFEEEAATRDDMIALTRWDAMRRLEERRGMEVEVLALVGDVREGDGRKPTVVKLSRKLFSDVPVVFWDKYVFEDSSISRYRGEFVRVRATVTEYTFEKSGETQLQLEVENPAQVVTPPYDPPGKGGVGFAVHDRPAVEAPSMSPDTTRADPKSEPEPDAAPTPEPASEPEPAPGSQAPPQVEPEPPENPP